MAFRMDGKRSVRLWTAETPPEHAGVCLALDGDSRWVWDLVFSPDMSRGVQSGEKLGELREVSQVRTNGAFSHDGTRIVLNDSHEF